MVRQDMPDWKERTHFLELLRISYVRFLLIMRANHALRSVDKEKRFNPRKSEVIELRYFGGLNAQQQSTVISSDSKIYFGQSGHTAS